MGQAKKWKSILQRQDRKAQPDETNNTKKCIKIDLVIQALLIRHPRTETHEDTTVKTRDVCQRNHPFTRKESRCLAQLLAKGIISLELPRPEKLFGHLRWAVRDPGGGQCLGGGGEEQGSEAFGVLEEGGMEVIEFGVGVGSGVENEVGFIHDDGNVALDKPIKGCIQARNVAKSTVQIVLIVQNADDFRIELFRVLFLNPLDKTLSSEVYVGPLFCGRCLLAVGMRPAEGQSKSGLAGSGWATKQHKIVFGYFIVDKLDIVVIGDIEMCLGFGRLSKAKSL